ncbi:MAG: hypothetical protein IPM96_20425 [Ignavibacteria bacterium]|nr:hypothetical protein [Ignavibacteria bacterium]
MKVVIKKKIVAKNKIKNPSKNILYPIMDLNNNGFTLNMEYEKYLPLHVE